MMKARLLMSIVLLTGMVMADSFEVKTGEGHRVKTTSVPGVFKSKHESRFPYVCYDKRVKMIIDNRMYLVYNGCARYNGNCKRLGRAHFGKYPNDLKAYEALQRCVNARPKFVD